MAIFTDLKLDSETHDILVSGKDLAVVQDTPDAITQRLKIRLKFFKGEWFLNTLFGIPFYQRIFVKGVTKGQVDGIFRSGILSTPGVVDILTFTSTLDRDKREYTLSFSCRVSTGETIILEV